MFRHTITPFLSILSPFCIFYFNCCGQFSHVGNFLRCYVKPHFRLESAKISAKMKQMHFPCKFYASHGPFTVPSKFTEPIHIFYLCWCSCYFILRKKEGNQLENTQKIPPAMQNFTFKGKITHFQLVYMRWFVEIWDTFQISVVT